MDNNQLTPEQRRAIAKNLTKAGNQIKAGLWGFLFLFLLAGGGIFYFIYVAFQGPPAANSSQPPVMVSAMELVNAYSSNQVSADNTYKGNLIEVNGIIDTIGKDILNNPYVALQGSFQGGNDVQCGFDQSQENDLATLQAGERATLEGTGNGYSIGDPELVHCSIVATSTP
jgi:hypothetical protein